MSKIDEKGAEIRKVADEVRKVGLMINETEQHLEALRAQRTQLTYDLSDLWSELNELVTGGPLGG
jgi:uncharacterized coiled-coil DUF342 family protein